MLSKFVFQPFEEVTVTVVQAVVQLVVSVAVLFAPTCILTGLFPLQDKVINAVWLLLL